MSWPHVYKRKDGRWDVDTGLKIKPRRRQICETLADVELVKADWQAEFRRGGSDHTLSPHQRHDAFQALALLERSRAKESLSDAVAWFIKHRYPDGGDLTVQELADRFVEAKRTAMVVEKGTQERRPRYSRPYLSSLTKILKLGEKFANKRLSELTDKDLAAYLDSLPLGETARWHYFHYFRMLFNFGVKHQYLERNPMSRMQAPLLERPEPTVLTSQQVGELLEAAWNDHDGCCIPYIVLGLFCGVRPHELQKLKWGDFRDDRRRLRIPQRIAKTRDVRVVNVPTCATAMINEHWERIGKPGPETLLVPMTHNLLRKRFRQAFRAAGLKEWPHDAARHTFASFYLKATGSMPKLMEQMGHASPTMSLRHYVNLVDDDWIHYFTMGATEKQWQDQRMYIVELEMANGSADDQPKVREAELARLLLEHDYSVLPLEKRPNYKPIVEGDSSVPF